MKDKYNKLTLLSYLLLQQIWSVHKECRCAWHGVSHAILSVSYWQVYSRRDWMVEDEPAWQCKVQVQELGGQMTSYVSKDNWSISM